MNLFYLPFSTFLINSHVHSDLIAFTNPFVIICYLNSRLRSAIFCCTFRTRHIFENVVLSKTSSRQTLLRCIFKSLKSCCKLKSQLHPYMIVRYVNQMCQNRRIHSDFYQTSPLLFSEVILKANTAQIKLCLFHFQCFFRVFQLFL